MAFAPKKGRLKEVADAAVKGELIRALAGTNGRVPMAATNLGVGRTQMYDLMRRYGIKIERRTTGIPVQRGPKVNGDGEWS